MKIEDICPMCGRKEEGRRTWDNGKMLVVACLPCGFQVHAPNDWNRLSKQRQILQEILDDLKQGALGLEWIKPIKEILK